jgi:DNA-binding response OmpR family regulator
MAKVLIVDDDPSTRAVLAKVLVGFGHEPVEAETFEEGRRLLAVERPDVLITDIRLGASNGLQLVVGSPEARSTIVLTGFADPVLERDARKAGAQYSVKPVSGATLSEMIETALARRNGAD